MLRATDQIRDAVRQMSALALCSRHECCWHTNRRGMAARGKARGKKGREQSEHRGRGGWHEMGEQEKKKGVGEFACHFLQTSSAGRDILRHISVRNQFGQKEMLQVQTYLQQLTPTDLGDELDVLTLILRNKRLREATHKPRLCAVKKT